DLVFLSFADSERAALSSAARQRASTAPTVAFVNLRTLEREASIEAFIADTATNAQLIVVRLLGGAGYWPHGIERLRALAQNGGPALIVVPGGTQWDAALAAASIAPPDASRRLWPYLAGGGPENCRGALA